MAREKKIKPKTVPEPKGETPTPTIEPLAAEAVTTAPHEPPPAASPEDPGPVKTWVPKGPRWFQTVNLSEEKDGPRMRLGRDNRFHQMAIAFDEKPTEETRQRLHDDGWRWRPAEGQWTKQLESDRRVRGQQDAEKLFDEVARIERRDRQVREDVGAIRH